jgi:N-acyl-D-aspartate/D-glutamate deacylase
MNDITIRNVQILDGLGGQACAGDVGIRDGRITEVGSAGPGMEEVAGQGQ